MMNGTTQVMRKFCLDKFTFDADAKVTETSEYLTVEPVTLVREGVYPYEDGRALKPGDELSRGAEVSRLYIAWDHPPLRVITRPQEIKGFVDGVHAEKDNKGVKVKGTLSFNKKSLTQDQVELIRSKVRRDVSLGFYYTEDRTPGSWNEQQYDYIQRDFVFDHVASVEHGRCAFPQCGIGVDADALNMQAGIGANVRIGNDPYPNEHSCRLKDPSGFQAKSFGRVKRGKVSLIMARLKGERTMTLQAIRYPTSSWSEAEAKKNCHDKGGSFEPASSSQSDTVMTKGEDVPGGQKFAATTVNLRAPGENSEENCEHCIFYDWIKKQDCSIVEGAIAGNMTCDEWTGKPTLERWILGVQRGNASEPPEADSQSISPKKMNSDDAAKFLRELRSMDRPALVRLHERMHKAENFSTESLAHRCVLFALKKAKPR